MCAPFSPSQLSGGDPSVYNSPTEPHRPVTSGSKDVVAHFFTREPPQWTASEQAAAPCPEAGIP
jgi:hypothetical protein